LTFVLIYSENEFFFFLYELQELTPVLVIILVLFFYTCYKFKLFERYIPDRL